MSVSRDDLIEAAIIRTDRDAGKVPAKGIPVQPSACTTCRVKVTKELVVGYIHFVLWSPERAPLTMIVGKSPVELPEGRGRPIFRMTRHGLQAALKPSARKRACEFVFEKREDFDSAFVGDPPRDIRQLVGAVIVLDRSRKKLGSRVRAFLSA